MLTAAKTPANDVCLLDNQLLKTLNELSDDPSESMVKELADLFFETTPPLLAQLASAMRDKQFDVALRLAHRLKGSAANIGALQFSAFCAELEQKIKLTPEQMCRATLDEINSSFCETQKEITNWLSLYNK